MGDQMTNRAAAEEPSSTRSRMAAILRLADRARAIFAGPEAAPAHSEPGFAELIAALDDRKLDAALRVLQPGDARVGEGAPRPKCVGCGE
jgi:hypothetical protein